MMAMMTGREEEEERVRLDLPSEGGERSSGAEESHAALWRRLALQKHIQKEKTKRQLWLG